MDLLKLLAKSLVFSENWFFVNFGNIFQIFLGYWDKSLCRRRRITVGSFVDHHPCTWSITSQVYPNNCIVPANWKLSFFILDFNFLISYGSVFLSCIQHILQRTVRRWKTKSVRHIKLQMFQLCRPFYELNQYTIGFFYK